jgi:hypothetical protein
MIKWLEEHPINLDDDLAFLKRKVEDRKRAAMQAVWCTPRWIKK